MRDAVLLKVQEKILGMSETRLIRLLRISTMCAHRHFRDVLFNFAFNLLNIVCSLKKAPDSSV